MQVFVVLQLAANGNKRLDGVFKNQAAAELYCQRRNQHEEKYYLPECQSQWYWESRTLLEEFDEARNVFLQSET